MKIKNLSRIVGLWMAEGSTTSRSEITFTNSQPELIQFFHNNIFRFVKPKNKPRIYVYRKNKNEKIELPVKNIVYRFYIHPFARRPFFIYRISGVKLVREWLSLVEHVKNQPGLYRFVLQGFFAGEGNLKYIISTRSRVLRISQGKPNKFIEKVFQVLNLKFHYEQSERSYVISGRENLERLWKLGISELHPIKHKKFRLMLESYKQRHLGRGELRKKILELSDRPKTTMEMANAVDKSGARVSRVLSQLGRENLLNKFKIGSLYYWVNSSRNIILISEVKLDILKILRKPRRVYEISKIRDVNWKSSFKRLKELEKLKLVRQRDGLWYRLPTNKEVVTLRR